MFNDFLYQSFRSEEDVKTRRIVGFDLVNEEIKEFPVMSWLIEYDLKASFLVMNGRLSLLCTSKSKPIADVWTLKNCNEWSCWEKSYSFHFDDFEYGMTILDITPSGKLLTKAAYRKMCSYFTQIKIINPIQDTEMSSIDVSDWKPIDGKGYVETLVSPFGTIKPGEDVEDDDGNYHISL